MISFYPLHISVMNKMMIMQERILKPKLSHELNSTINSSILFSMSAYPDPIIEPNKMHGLRDQHSCMWTMETLAR